ncbi:SDR family NAD(P)-dependent oxidoreductase [Peribacillus frigoritolerans]|uniref:SDR family NAD(P)-dependent oxidoreductase n=1 Tax=Peribacillus frigoritolerans TaxID=450367 RepID=UPI00256FF6FC|nr:SDR family oxidoreductase [Peribacillus frigoritolerans]
MKLKSKTALVTGASRGLGKVIAAELATMGADVYLNYAHSDEHAKIVQKQIEQAGGRAFLAKGDITSEEGVRQVTMDRTFDILVNNATGPQPELSIEEASWEDYEDQLKFFVKAPFLLLKAVMPGMKKQKNGSIINIGSEVISLGNPSFSNYVTAKAAMLGMTRSWASELGEYGIRVNLVNPGFIPVERHENVQAADIHAYQSTIPLNRMGTPEDIAKAVAYLASEDSAYITGQSISVNGGNTFGI